MPRKDDPPRQTHTEQLREHLGRLTPDDFGLKPEYLLTHLIYISERLDRLEAPMNAHRQSILAQFFAEREPK
jgi:hypothetical protein